MPDFCRKMTFNSYNAHKALLMCVFVAFAFCYVNFMQGDAMACAWHRLFGGSVRYNILAGALAVVVLAVALQVAVSRIIAVRHLNLALSYVPSALLLDSVAVFFQERDLHRIVAYAVVLLVWGAICAKPLPFLLRCPTPLKELNASLAAMLLIVAAVAFSCSHDTVSHYELRVARLLDEGRIDEALEVGKNSRQTSVRLVQLRAYALSRKGLLCERLFEYPVAIGTRSLLPPLADSVRMVFNPENIYRWLGVQHGNALKQPQAGEYSMATMLLNRQLDSFAAAFRRQWGDTAKTENTPRHLREAIVMYRRLRTAPVLVIDDRPTETNYNDFIKIMHTPGNVALRKNALQSQYGDTYWWYYYFEKPEKSKHNGNGSQRPHNENT